MKIEHVAFNVADPVAMADWYCRHCDRMHSGPLKGCGEAMASVRKPGNFLLVAL